jgi:hypothetical protein
MTAIGFHRMHFRISPGRVAFDAHAVEKLRIFIFALQPQPLCMPVFEMGRTASQEAARTKPP